MNQRDTKKVRQILRYTTMSAILAIFLNLPVAPAFAGEIAFPGAVGWAAATPGGRGGEIIRVTSLDSKGPGSLREAMQKKGPRIIVFEVGGVIDLEMETLRLTEPFVTIAGQTAPSPGITIIKGGMDIATHDVVVQHLRIRPGSAGQARGSGWGEDGIATTAAYNVIVDHCSLSWATDENLSASGPRFTGESPEEWRKGTSHDITFSHNIIAEGLADSSHPKFEHSKGSLIHDNASNILIYQNLYSHNYERNPHLKGGVHAAIVNNFIYDPGQRAMQYNLMGLEWGDVPFEVGKMTVIGNVMRAGPSTADPIALVMLGGHGDVEIYEHDNIAVDRIGEPLPKFGRYAAGAAQIIHLDEPPLLWPGLTILPADEVELSVQRNAGARPWDRDSQDVRILMNAGEGRGMIIDNEVEVGGYPKTGMTRKAFVAEDWNLATMTPKHPDVLDSASKARGT